MRRQNTLALALCALMFACEDPQATLQTQSLVYIQDWFNQAHLGNRDPNLCHGLGVLKHPEITCLEMLEHAASVAPESRQVNALTPRDCFGKVCGEFVEIGFDSMDQQGNSIRENAVLKRDAGTLRLYWYRSDSLLALLVPADQEKDQKDPLQLTYDRLTALHPELYSYPPCYGVRASSSNLVGELYELEQLPVATIEKSAAQCGASFCFATVGSKIATLCPSGPT